MLLEYIPTKATYRSIVILHRRSVERELRWVEWIRFYGTRFYKKFTHFIFFKMAGNCIIFHVIIPYTFIENGHNKR